MTKNILSSDPFHNVWVNNCRDVYAVGNDGAIMHYDGDTWHEDLRGLPATQLNGVWGSSSNNVYSVGGGLVRVPDAGIDWGLILHYNGHEWQISLKPGWVKQLFGIWGSRSNDIYAVGNNGTIVHDRGFGWNQIAHGLTEARLTSIWGSSSNVYNVYVVPFQGDILHYDGVTWHRIDHGFTSNAMYSIWGNGSELYVAGVCSRGEILCFDGHKWRRIELTSNGLTGVWRSSTGDVYAVGVGGTIIKIDLSTGGKAGQRNMPGPR